MYIQIIRNSFYLPCSSLMKLKIYQTRGGLNLLLTTIINIILISIYIFKTILLFITCVNFSQKLVIFHDSY